MAYVSYRIFSVNVKAPLFIAQVGLIIYTLFSAWFLQVNGATSVTVLFFSFVVLSMTLDQF